MSDLLYKKEGTIARIILNRPEKRNAINGAIITGIDESLKDAAKDPEVRVVILEGAGEKAFTAGFDLKEAMENNITAIVDRREDTEAEVEFFLRMWHFPKPIIGKIQGYCIGGGVSLAMLCDMIVASENAVFGNPEIVLGFIPEFPMEAWKMPFNKVREFFYLGKYFSAKEMEAMNVVNFVVPFEELDKKAVEVAKRVTQIPADSVKMLKYSMNMVYEMQGFLHTVDFTKELFNLGRTHMQQNEVTEFKEDIEKGGLKAALHKQYN